MAVAETGNISIKTAAGTGRSIDTDGRTDISSGSLVTLSTGDVVTTNNTIDGSTPHGMNEFRGYEHQQPMVFHTEVFSGRQASAGYMGRIAESDNFGGGMSVIITGPEYYLYQYVTTWPITIYNYYLYIRRDIGGVNNSTYSQYVNSSGTISLLSNSTWQQFATYAVTDVAVSGGPDTMQLNIVSHSDNNWGSGGLLNVFSQNNGSFSNDVNPAGTAVTLPSFSRQYGWGGRLTSEAECSSFYAERTTTYSVTWKKSGYADYTTPEWKFVHDHDHNQSGSC